MATHKSFSSFLILENNMAILEDVFNIANNLSVILANYINHPNKDPQKFLQSADRSIRAFCILKAFYTAYIKISPDKIPLNTDIFYSADTGDLMAYLLSNYNFNQIPDSDDVATDARHVLINAKFVYTSVIKAIETNDMKSMNEFLRDVERIEKYFKSIKAKAMNKVAA